jgi:DNA-binding SARP family transcriptional activator
MTDLCIHLLGPFQVLQHGQPLQASEWRSIQVRAIFKLLLTQRERVVPADYILDVLWPDDELQTARRRLHVRISQLRRALNPDDPSAYILTVEGGYTFNLESAYWLDTEEFEAHAQWGRRCQENDELAQAISAYETARAFYRGDFLVKDLYADWTFAERERLRERFLTMLTELAECYALQGRYRRAITRCREALAADPCRESIYLRLMLYHYYAGERDQALRAYQRCRQTLSDELDVEPLPQTSALYEQILRQQLKQADEAARYPAPVYDERPFQAPHSLQLTPFVGREDEYAWLAASLRSYKFVAVAGEAGLGKTRLAQQALEYTRQQGALTLAANCYEVESDAPYQPLIEALQSLMRQDAPALQELAPQWRAELERLFAHLYPGGPAQAPPVQGQRRQLFEAVSQLLQASAAAQPIVVFVDDAQWADSSSLALLNHLARRMDGLPVAWLLNYRPEEVSARHPLRALLDALRRDGRLAEKDLTPLSTDTIVALITRLASSVAPDPALSERLAHESAGNPFYLVSILQNLFEEGVLSKAASGSWTLSRDIVGKASELMLPPTLQKTLERRLDRLQPGDRRTLQAAAVLGRPFDLDLLQRISGVSEDDLLDTLDRLIESRLLAEWPATGCLTFDFSHSKLCKATYLCLKSARRQRLHQRAFQALLDVHGSSPGASAELAYHSYRGGRPAEAVQFAIQAGEYAQRLYAGRQAVEHLQNAVNWAEQARLTLGEEQRATIHSNWGRALQLSGRYDESLTHLEQALPLARGERKQQVIFWICRMEAIHRGRLDQYNRLVPALEHELAHASDQWAVAALRWTQGYFATIQGQFARSREYHSAGWRMARRLLARNERVPPLVKAEGYIKLADCHERWGDWQHTIRYAGQALEIFTAHNDLSGIANSHVLLQAAHYGLGQGEQSLEHFEQCYALAVEGKDLGMQGHALYGSGRVYLERGDWATAQEHAQRLLDAASSSGDVVRRGFGQVLLARLAMRQGRPQQALPTLQTLENMARAQNALGYVAQLRRYLAEAELLSGEIKEALSTAREGAELAARCGYKREWGGLLWVLGQALARSGEQRQAEVRLLEAIALAQRIHCRYDLAQAERSLGKLYAEYKPRQAQEHLDAALALFESLGAKHDASITRQALA